MTMELYTHVTEEMKQREVKKITLTGLSPIGVKNGREKNSLPQKPVKSAMVTARWA